MAEFQWKIWKHKLFYTKCLWISYFFQIFTFIGSSVICLSLSEIPIWTHQREFELTVCGEIRQTLDAKCTNKIIFKLLSCSSHLWVFTISYIYNHKMYIAWTGHQPGNYLSWHISQNITDYYTYKNIKSIDRNISTLMRYPPFIFQGVLWKYINPFLT